MLSININNLCESVADEDSSAKLRLILYRLGVFLTQSFAFPGKVPLIANLILGGLLVWVMAGWFDSNGRVAVQVEQGSAPIQEMPALSELRGNLFGQPSSSTSIKPVVKKVVKSALNIKLLGTVVAGENSAAVIAVQGSPQEKAVFIGSMIQSGVKLHSVEADAVIVDRNGNLEKIVMVKSGQLASTPMTPSLQLNRSVRPVTGSMINQQAMPAVASAEFLQLLSQARVTPHFANGKADGFLVNNIVPDSIYAKAGLRNGDVVRKVNGQTINNAQQAMAMYQALQNGGGLEVELLRAGQVQQLHYDFANR